MRPCVMAESDLYLPVKRFLEAQGYVVKGEVKECDVVGVRGDEAPLIVELKTTFSLQLLLQGVDRQAISDAVYLAFGPPKRRQRSDILKLCKRLGLGVLIVTGDLVEPLVDPVPYQPRRNTRRASLLLKEFAHRVGDLNTGGTTRRPRMTAYRQDVLRLVAHLKQNGPTKAAIIKQETGVPRTATLLQNDVYGWFLRENRGIYTLSSKGVMASQTYSDVIHALIAATSSPSSM